MTMREAYKAMLDAWIKENDIKVGDYVKILRSFELNELGAPVHRNPSIEEKIGKIEKITQIDKESIEVNSEWFYPFFVLEKVKSVKLPSDKIIQFINDKCDFNCQQENVKTIVQMMLDRIGEKK